MNLVLLNFYRYCFKVRWLGNICAGFQGPAKRTCDMRIIAGTARGRRLIVPPTNDVRPTTDRVREALFSSLADSVHEGAILDLFAGSGALGLESLSRGARTAVFVEQSRAIFSCLKKNISALGFDSCCTCYVANALSWLKRQKGTGQVFDLIFLDPPYDGNYLQPVLDLIVEARCLTSTGKIVAEHRDGFPVEDLNLHPALSVRRTRKYGNTAITIIEWSTQPENG
jgi:16S rRNA (guanine966-N2)-methyltransferase